MAERTASEQPPQTATVRAELVTIGDELLSGDTVNTNASAFGERCRGIGVTVVRTLAVRDRVEEIACAVAEAAARAPICVVCGGLGPTTDDRTAEAVAQAAGVDLVRDDEAEQRLAAKFAAFGRPMPDSNRKQADFPAGAEILPNPIGTAEGFAVNVGDCQVFVVPGVPREMRKMVDEQVLPRVAKTFDLQPVPRRIYRCLGIGESSAAQRIAPVLAEARQRSPGLAAMFVHYRASMPQVMVILEATAGPNGAGATPEELAGLDNAMREALAPGLYGLGDALLAPRVLAALERGGLTLATAESCTGGGVARLLAAVPGASNSFVGSIVAYDNRIKVQRLGVSETELAAHGAVSEHTARAMAQGGREALGSDLCVAVTGIAGPSGGTADKPVGTVHFAVCDGDTTEHKRVRLLGNRGTVQRSAEVWALKLTWDRLHARGLAPIEELFEKTTR